MRGERVWWLAQIDDSAPFRVRGAFVRWHIALTHLKISLLEFHQTHLWCCFSNLAKNLLVQTTVILTANLSSVLRAVLCSLDEISWINLASMKQFQHSYQVGYWRVTDEVIQEAMICLACELRQIDYTKKHSKKFPMNCDKDDDLILPQQLRLTIGLSDNRINFTQMVSLVAPGWECCPACRIMTPLHEEMEETGRHKARSQETSKS